MNSSPGSYVTERDLSQRVRAVSTSIGAIVGASKKGPIMETTLVTNEQEFIEMFGPPDWRFSLMHYAALEFLKKSSRLMVTRVVNDDLSRGAVPLTAGAFYSVDSSSAIEPRPTLSVFDDGSSNALGIDDPYNTYSFNPNQAGIENVLFFVCACNPGDWNNRIYIEVRPAYKAGLSEFDENYDDPYSFWIDVYMDYDNPRDHPVESYLVKRSRETNGFGNQMFLEDVINKSSKYIRVRNNEFAPEKVKVVETAKVFLEGGTNGGRVSYGQVMRGWDLYSDTEHINVNILIQGGAPIGMTALQDVADIQRKMLTIAEDRMDAVAILDVPSSEQETARAVAYSTQTLNVDSSYGALYTCDMRVPDTYNDMDVWVPPSGFVAANCAMTDEDYEVWFSPAGMYRGRIEGANKSKYIYNQGHRDALDAANVNAIRYFPKGQGWRVWGSNTLQSMASALSDLNVRRLMNFIEKSVRLANMYSVFDPNDQILRSRVTTIIERFLTPIKNAGGLYWFKVVCDDSNNTPETIMAGVLVIDAYFDPVITAKRIHLRANLMATGAEFKTYLTNK